MNPIRILHLPNTLDKKSGVMSVVMNFYRNIDRSKVQFDFLCFTSEFESYEDEIIALGGKVYFIDSKFSKNILKIRNELIKFFKKNNYTTIHYHSISIWNLALKISKMLGVTNRIAHSHATNYSENKFRAIRNRIYTHNLIKSANHYMACSTEAGKLLFKNENFMLINNAIDVNRFSYNHEKRKEYRNQLNLENCFVLGHVGRFAEQKNHNYLIDLFYEYRKINHRARLLLVGEGPLKTVVEEKIKELGLQKDILILEFTSQIENYYQAMDVFVLPSLYEGLPVSGIEAQAAGLPCIFSNNISQEVAIFEAIKFIDIKLEPVFNLGSIVEIERNYIRKKTDKKIRKKNYDITEEALKLQDFYLSIDI